MRIDLQTALSCSLSQVQRPSLPTADALLPYLKLIDGNRWYSNCGELVLMLEARLTGLFGCDRPGVTSFASGTLALEAAILGHAGWAGAERPLALVPSYAFVATAQAAMRCGYSLHLWT